MDTKEVNLLCTWTDKKENILVLGEEIFRYSRKKFKHFTRC